MKHNFYGFFSFSLFILSLVSCSDDYWSDNTDIKTKDSTDVNIHINTVSDTDSVNSISTRADANQSNFKDILIMIFNAKDGNVIGSSYGPVISKPDGSTDISLKAVKTSFATVYVVANAGTSNSMGPFSKISTKTDFDNVYDSIKTAKDLENRTFFPMFGKIDYFRPAAQNASLTIKRLSAKVCISVKPAKNVILDSIQLCHVPLSAFFYDDKIINTSSPKGYTDFPTEFIGSTGKEIDKYFYIFENLAGTGKNIQTDGWKGRTYKNAPLNATYIRIKAHSDTWNSSYIVYLGGKSSKKEGTNYFDLSDYNIYRNSYQKYSISITGANNDDDGTTIAITPDVNISEWVDNDKRNLNYNYED